MGKKEIEEGKACAILSWIFPIGLIWFLIDEKMRKNNFAKFHVQQSLVLVILSVIVSAAGSIIPIFGWFIILPIGSLICFIFWIMGIIGALMGNEKELPWVGKYGEKFNF